MRTTASRRWPARPPATRQGPRLRGGGLTRAAATCLATLSIIAGPVACGARQAEEVTHSQDADAVRGDPVRNDQRLARLEYCREAIALKVRESWRDISRNFDESGQLRRTGRVVVYPVHRGLSRACDQLLRDEHGDYEDNTIAYGRVQTLVELASLYAADTRALHSLGQEPRRNGDARREAEAVFAHMRALYAEWDRVERALQLDASLLQGMNNEALLAYLDAEGAHLQRRKVEFVIALRKMRRCYTEPEEKLACEGAVDRVFAAFHTWSGPLPRTDALQFDQRRSKIFWIAAFEEDAATLISLLKKRPLSITKDGPAVGLSFDATIDLAVGRVLRDASTLAFDFP